MGTFTAEQRLPLYLFHAEAFPRLAADFCVITPERELVFTGKLTPLQIGRRRYYDYRELLALAPDWFQVPAATAALIERETTAGGTR